MVTTLAPQRAPDTGIPTSGLVYRFRAADLAGPPVAGSNVNSLPDSTGVTGAATASSSLRPTYQPTGVGGKPSILVSGTGEWFTIPSLTRHTQIMVVQPTENPNFGTYRRLFADATGSGTGKCLLTSTGVSQFFNHATDPDGVDYGIRRSELRVNGNPSPAAISPLNVPLIIATDNTSAVTGAMVLFTYSTGNGAQNWAGHVSEILVWNRKLSPSERMAAERELGIYYNISTRS